jgi:hypothetical protein
MDCLQYSKEQAAADNYQCSNLEMFSVIWFYFEALTVRVPDVRIVGCSLVTDGDTG